MKNMGEIELNAFVEWVESFAGCARGDMTSSRGPRGVARLRMAAMASARHLEMGSLAEVGEAFGGRTHGTICHAVKRCDAKPAMAALREKFVSEWRSAVAQRKEFAKEWKLRRPAGLRELQEVAREVLRACL